MKLPKIAWYSAIYLAIAVATFKHSAWGFGSAIEGPSPTIDWNTLPLSVAGFFAVTQLITWYFWGGLMAVATDVGLFFTARALREARIDGFSWNEDLPLWVAYVIAAGLSAFTQFYYAASHAAELTIVKTALPELQSGGWLYWLLEYRVIILPLALPGMSAIYTLALKVKNQAVVEKPGKIDIDKGVRVFTLREAAAYTGYSESWVRQKAASGQLGHKDAVAGWVFTEDELKPFKKSS